MDAVHEAAHILLRPSTPRVLVARVRMLTFCARRFAWRVEGESTPAGGEARDCVVVFAQLEAADIELWDSVRRKAVKHIRWQANKLQLRAVVLHSFTHLGAARPAAMDGAREHLEALGARLTEHGYSVSHTPFGHSCAWELDVFGESVAKVWKEI